MFVYPAPRDAHAMEFDGYPPLTLYIHLPWCARKCPYCDFNSHEAPAEIPAERYVDALAADLEQELPDVWGRPLEAIFIGGGTPSLFPPEAIDRLLARVRMYLNPAPDIEVTLEANPGSAESARFAGYRAAGVNRLSLGVQSFDDAALKRIGRIHSASEADLDSAIALGVDHISWYQLTLEPNTVFWSQPPALPEEETSAAIEAHGAERLQAAGFDRYEISAWARGESPRCRHNLNYWRFGDYLGIGAGAHGKLTLPDAAAIERRAKVRAPRAYLERADGPNCIADRRRLSAADAAFELCLNALRLPEGFSPAQFAERTGLPFAWLQRPLAEAEARGLIAHEVDGVRPTRRGLDFHNDLLALIQAEIDQWGTGREAAAAIPIVSKGTA
ncbi:MAG: oxygen-independent coproporphyrinogen III oxidase-like protein [Proteobacteria bacterium SW_6_67_9]|nr:MAG: oxygen-independent coproporphyrinogen III oxidase-like protein [Proteobacteria bacterium SW_6_67_9]